MTPPSPYRRWLRFSLRTSLIVMLVVCCGLAYWKHQQQGRRFAFQDEFGKWGFVSQHGWVVVKPQYRHAIDYVDGLARVQVDGRLCYIDLKGVVRFKLPPGTGSTYPFSEGRLWFESKEGKWGLCDDHGKILVEPTFTAVSPFEDGMAQVAVGGTVDPFDGYMEGESWGYVDREGKLVIPAVYDYVDAFSDGLAHVSDSDGRKFIDKTGTVIIEIEEGTAGNFREGVAPVYIDRSLKGKPWQTQFINKAGDTEFVVGGYASEFREGMALLHRGNYGFIDRNGRIAIQPQFAEAFDFHEGLAAVRPTKTTVYGNGDSWGFIDKSGKWVIKPRFNKVESFQGGVAKVHVGGELVETSHYVFWEGGDRLLIDKRGKVLRKLHESDGW